MKESILIICESGITATLLLSKLLKSVRDRDLNYDLDYAPMKRVKEKLEQKSYNILLLTPQVARYHEELKDIIKKEKCHSKIIFIDEHDFHSMNADAILEKTFNY
ncbi:MAG: PTS cellobiose transporter subunit IIC [Carnobacterium sp.]|nr:PTS cellobiose transporter subunit IIC [Carnobacterium sp.]